MFLGETACFKISLWVKIDKRQCLCYLFSNNYTSRHRLFRMATFLGHPVHSSAASGDNCHGVGAREKVLLRFCE